MVRSLRVFYGTVLTLVSMLCATTYAATAIVDPSTLPGNTVDADFGPQAAIVRKAYQDYVLAAKAGTLSKAQPILIATVRGSVVDLKATFSIINQINIALLKDGSQSLTALPADAKTVPTPTKKSLDQALDKLKLTTSPTVVNPAVVVARVPPANPVIAAPISDGAAIPCPQASPGVAATPTPFNAKAAWEEIQALQRGKTATGAALDRCSLTFIRALERAESSPPIVSTSPSPIPLPSVFGYGNAVANASLQPSLTIAEDTSGTFVHGETALTGNVYGFAKDLKIFSLGTDIVSDSSGKATRIKFDITAANQPVYSMTFSGSYPALPLSLTQPTSIDLFPRIKTNVQSLLSLPVPLELELACVGTIGLNGTVTTTDNGIFFLAQPTVSATVTGQVSASYLIANAEVTAKLTLVDISGKDMGFIATVVTDPTASAFRTSFASAAPVIALFRPFGSITYSAFQGQIRVRGRIAGYKLLDRSFPVIKGFSTSTDVNVDWSAAYLTDAKTSKASTTSNGSTTTSGTTSQ